MVKPAAELLSILDSTSGDCSYAGERVESIHALFLAIGKLCDADYTIAGLAALGASIAEDLAADLFDRRDALNAEVNHG